MEQMESTFLASHRTNNYLPLTVRLLPLVPSPTPALSTTYQEALTRFPLSYQQVIGTYHILIDNDIELARHLRDGTTLDAYCDVTVKEAKVAHSYTVRTPDHNNDLCIQGSAIIPAGHPETLCSLRPEHFGLFAIAIHLEIICDFHYIQASSNTYVVIHIDNKAVRQRSLTGIPENMKGTSRVCPDYDVWSETINILHRLPITVAIKPVKGHQADTLYSQFRVRGPVPRHAHYNEQCDEWAAVCRDTNEHQYTTHVFPASRAALVISNHVIPHPTRLLHFCCHYTENSSLYPEEDKVDDHNIPVRRLGLPRAISK